MKADSKADNSEAHDVPAAAAAAHGQDGLSSVAEIEALADHLTACADNLHERIMNDLARYEGKPVPPRQQAITRALFDDEQVLRQQANGLYADATTIVVKGLGKSQQQVVELTVAAAEKIRKITLLGDVAGLVGGLLKLAGAAATGQAAPIVLALEKIRKQMKAIDAHSAKKPA